MIDDLIFVITNSIKLHRLEVANCNLTDNFLVMFTEALNKRNNIAYIDLRMNEFSLQIIKQFLCNIRSSANLEYVLLDDTYSAYDEITTIFRDCKAKLLNLAVGGEHVQEYNYMVNVLMRSWSTSMFG